MSKITARPRLTALLLSAPLLSSALALSGAPLAHEALAEGVRQGAERQGAYRVATSTYPLYAWARALLKGVTNTHIELVTPPNQDPAVWLPTSEALTRYQSASLVLLNGAHFEQWASKVSLPPSRVLESAEGMRGEWLHYETTLTHQHGPEGEHSHEGVDGHTWLDPHSALKQIAELSQRLSRDLPTHAALIKRNELTLNARIKTLDEQWSAFAEHLKAKHPNVVIWSSHPAYQYLKRHYKLPIKALDLNPDGPLSEGERQQLTTALKGLSEAQSVMFWWEGAPSEGVSEALKATLKERLKVSVTVSPLETAQLNNTQRSGEAEAGYLKAYQEVLTALQASVP